ncbi:MAG TPA: hypothetical protein VNY24_03005 [Candidatus Acidoferrales bacterium]|jgi:hypothetical protein|nr:hypothetical protein [Candidatus Acidoferrales bacterium]
MWKRKCPLCFVRIPWTAALAHSYEIGCPACHAPLELSRFTRIFGAFGGIAGAFVAVHLAHGVFHGTFWVIPIVAAILAFGFVSALCVLIAGDLAVRPKPASASFPHPTR